MLVNDYLGQGAGPIPLGSEDGASLSAYPFEVFQSPLLDLTLPVSGIELIPAKPGYIGIIELGNWDIERVTGTQTTPPTVRAGSDVARTNSILTTLTTPTNANVAAAVVPCMVAGPTGAVSNNPSARQLVNSTVYLDITVGASGTGGYSCFAKLVCSVFWLAVGG